MTKKDLVQNLNSIKLIIGNGFDLHCKLSTSYRDYFLHDMDKNNHFINWIDKFSSNVRTYTNFKISNHRDFWIEFDNFDKANIWDFFFILLSERPDAKPENWLWCDIEDIICEWLHENTDKGYIHSIHNWGIVYDILSSNNSVDYEIIMYILAAVAYKKNGEKKFTNKEEFYIFLLNELKQFEFNFGEYIFSLHYKNTPFGKKSKTLFRQHANMTINELCKLDNLCSIDSFNYDDLEDEKFDSILNNINGDYSMPIFGIDSNEFVAPDIRYIFSKTNRRMELDMLADSSRNYEEFKNIVIFGHSLNPADYSYFFSVFDKMNIVDLSNSSIIVFAFAVFDKKKEQQIKMNLRTSITKLFIDYSRYKGNSEQPNRLLDALTSQGKVLMYEINTIDTVEPFSPR